MDPFKFIADMPYKPVKQTHDHQGRRIPRILNLVEGNGKPPQLKFSLDMT